MSNYTIQEPLDTKKINLYNAANTFSYSISTPAITTNTQFPLPSTTGSTGEFLAYGSPSTWTPSIPIVNTTQYPMNFTFHAGARGFSNNTGGQENLRFLFPGTNAIGVPSSVRLVVGGVISSGARYRLFILPSTPIFDITITTTTAYTITTVSSFTNPFPTTPTTLSLDLVNPGSGITYIYNFIIGP